MNGWTNSTLYYSSCIRLLPNFSEKTEDYFSSRHSSGVALSEGATVATAKNVQNAVAYTALPVPVGTLFHLKCLQSGIIVITTIVHDA